MTFFGKIGKGLKRGLGKVANVGKTVLKKADNIVDKAEDIGKKVLSVPVVGDAIKAGWNELKARDPRFLALESAAKGVKGGIEKANKTIDNIEEKANKYIDNPQKLVSREAKQDFNNVRSQVRNIATIPAPAM